MGNRTVQTAAAAQAISRTLIELARRDAEPGSADALRAGHAAVRAIDTALRHLHDARSAVVAELIAEQAATDARVDALLARHRGAAS